MVQRLEHRHGTAYRTVGFSRLHTLQLPRDLQVYVLRHKVHKVQRAAKPNRKLGIRPYYFTRMAFWCPVRVADVSHRFALGDRRAGFEASAARNYQSPLWMTFSRAFGKSRRSFVDWVVRHWRRTTRKEWRTRLKLAKRRLGERITDAFWASALSALQGYAVLAAALLLWWAALLLRHRVCVVWVRVAMWLLGVEWGLRSVGLLGSWCPW